MNFDNQKLREAFGLFATGVMIASTIVDEKIKGLTINSFSSVSLNPPLVLFSIGNESSSLDVFRATKSYSLNILSKNQLEVAKDFAKSSLDKEKQLANYSLSDYNNPVFENSLAYFDCIHHQIIKAGDHHIFIGEIINFAKVVEGEGLFYYRGEFC